MKKILIYMRESNHPGAEEALERQRERLKAFSEQKGYVVVDEIATIGNRQDSLSALKQAIELAKNIEDKTLLMASTNRVVGTKKELIAVTELIESAGVTIATMDDSFESVQKYGTSDLGLVADTLSGMDGQ